MVGGKEGCIQADIGHICEESMCSGVLGASMKHAMSKTSKSVELFGGTERHFDGHIARSS